jgi:hypothetical protein
MGWEYKDHHKDYLRIQKRLEEQLKGHIDVPEELKKEQLLYRKKWIDELVEKSV